MNIRLQVAESSSADLEQYSRIDNIEVRGVPQTRGENIYVILDGTYLLPNAFQCPKINVSTHPSWSVEWLDAVKKERNIQTRNLHPSFNLGPVYIPEHLTQHNMVQGWQDVCPKKHTSRAIRILHSLRELVHLQNRQPQSWNDTIETNTK
ncbi:hypothetical protein J6590_066701 [Homalodisca vitripennis]|nr:hypothetical protein J6590_066701 [Homalodisca vitripennis]